MTDEPMDEELIEKLSKERMQEVPLIDKLKDAKPAIDAAHKDGMQVMLDYLKPKITNLETQLKSKESLIIVNNYEKEKLKCTEEDHKAMIESGQMMGLKHAQEVAGYQKIPLLEKIADLERQLDCYRQQTAALNKQLAEAKIMAKQSQAGWNVCLDHRDMLEKQLAEAKKKE